MTTLARSRTSLKPRRTRSRRVDLLAHLLRTSAYGVTHPGSALRTRAILHKLASLLPQRVVGVPGEWTRYGGVRARWFRPKGSSDKPIILYLHGGGYSLCSTDTHLMLISDLAKSTGLATVAVEYRLAPANPFPGPIDECQAVYRGLLANGYTPDQIVIAGESAGGALVLALLQRIRAAGLDMPRAALLLSPWVDLEMKGESIDTKASFDYLSRDVMDYMVRTYLQGADPSHPEASPINADFTGFPPMLIQGGAEELLISEIRLLASRAREHGVAVELQEWEGMFHAFHGFRLFIQEEPAEAFRAIGRYVDRVFAGDSSHPSRLPVPRTFVGGLARLRAFNS